MKKILLSAAFLALFFTACKKNDDDNDAAKQYWKVNDVTYTPLTVGTSGSSLTAAGATNSLIVDFNSSLPAANGTYKIVDIPTADNEMSIYIYNTAGTNVTSYTSSSYPNMNASITVNSNKVSVVIPEIWVINDADAADSVRVSANFTQD